MDSDQEEASQRLYWKVLLTVFIAAIAFVFYQNEAFHADFAKYFRPSPSQSLQLNTARLTIEFANGKKRAFEGQVASGMTVFSALKASQNAGKFEVTVDQRGHVLSIDGIGNNGKTWRVYSNGAIINDLPGHIEIKPGDKIMFRYE